MYYYSVSAHNNRKSKSHERVLEMEGKLDKRYENRLKALGKFHSKGLLWDRYNIPTTHCRVLQGSNIIIVIEMEFGRCSCVMCGRLNTIYVRSLIDSISLRKLFQVYLHNNYYFPQCKSRSREIQSNGSEWDRRSGKQKSNSHLSQIWSVLFLQLLEWTSHSITRSGLGQ